MSENVVRNNASIVLGERSEDALRTRLRGLSASLSGDDFVEFVVKLLLESNLDRERLKQRVVDLVAARFGKSSEKASPAQLALFSTLLRVIDGDEATLESEAAASAAPVSELMARTEAEIEESIVAQRQRQQEVRERRREAAQAARANGTAAENWPTHLPVVEVIREVPESARICDCCGVARKVIGHETSWRLEYRTTAEVVVTKTPIVACASHHGGPLTEAVAPKPVDGGRMGFSLAATILYLRFTQNLPVCRIVEMLAAQGVPVSEEMVHTLIRVTAKRAAAVVAALASQVRQAALVNLDDTPVRVLKKDGKSHPHKGRIWLALGDERWAWFFATETWKTEEAERKLGRLTGTIQGDGYAGYPKFAERQGTNLAGCWGHLRRKLLKAVQTKDPRAGPAMALVQGLYRVEKLATLSNLLPDQVVLLRQERSAPLVRALERWAVDVAPSIEGESPLGAAWTYLENQWEPLQVFLTDGHVSLTNDAAERGLRRITIGRQLWLFFQNDENASRAADIASLVATARLHGANELDYLEWLLHELARREWSPEAARCLLPDAWLATQQEQAQERSSVEG